MSLAIDDAINIARFRVHRERIRVVEEARSWLRTPFHHATKLKGVGVDCAQLLIACYCDTGIVAPVEPEYYAPDWFRHQDGEQFLEWVALRMTRVERPSPGDLILFRYGRSASHGAIALGNDTLIHAFRGRGVVIDRYGPHSPMGHRVDSAWTPWGNA